MADARQEMWKDIPARSEDDKYHARTMALDETVLEQALSEDQKISLALPLPDGRNVRFDLKKNSVMAPELSTKFPAIQSYDAISVDGKLKAKVDYNGTALYATIYTSKGLVYVDPDKRLQPGSYRSYFVSDYKNHKENKPVFEEPEMKTSGKAVSLKSLNNKNEAFRTSGGTLRKYRIAIAANSQYSQFHGQTTVSVLSAIVTTMNRVNGVYENDLSITMEIVAQNDELIFLTSVDDPYNGLSEPIDFLRENTSVLNSTIGANAYDIGHVFTTSSGGVANLGSVCTSNKAEGTTGVGSPVGDPFDIDFVAHEIGHQFGGTHTFNGTEGSCVGGNRTASTAYEPGSGSTILAYAGICGSDNLQNNSDPFFHVITLDQIIDFVTIQEGANCAALENTGNTPPTVTVDKTEYTIPPNTPFKLEAEGSDPDGDDITYSWEQFDLGPAGAPQLPQGDAPIFRAFSPTPDSFRIFPRLSTIISGSTVLGEALPKESREMNFRVVVRDNNPVGGGFTTESVRFFVNDESDPFRVTSPNLPNQSFIGGSTFEVTWNVGATNIGTFNTQLVNIWLSVDGGQNFDIMLVENTANDGTALVQLPEVTTSRARVMVEAVDNIFFNVNGQDFIITEAVEPGYTLRLSNSPLKVCAPDDITFEVFADRFGGFSEPVEVAIEGLDPALEVNIVNGNIEGGQSAIITISNTQAATQGSILFNLTGTTNSSVNVATPAELTVISGSTGLVGLISPENNDINVGQLPVFTWQASDIADSYYFELATDENFTNTLATEISLIQTSYTPDFMLESNTQYFWRVATNNECGRGDFAIASFRVANFRTTTEQVENLGIVIDETSSAMVTSTITIEDDFIVEDVNLIGLDITHSWIEDLTVTLISPAGTRVELFSAICGSVENILTNFDDESPVSAIRCPPIGNETFRPQNSLSTFDEENSRGDWILEVTDNAQFDGGILNGWGLELSSIVRSVALEVLPLSATEAELTWTLDPSVTGVTGFEIQSKSSEESEFTTVTTAEADARSIVVDMLEDDTFYEFRVVVLLGQGTGDSSNDPEILTFPAAPVELSAILNNSGNLIITWLGDYQTIEGFTLEQSLDGENFEVLAELNPTRRNFVIDQVEGGTQLFFRVKTANATGESAYSEVLSFLISSSDEPEEVVNIYPNPGEDYVTIKVNGMQPTSILVTDLSGKTLDIDIIDNGEGNFTLNSSYLKSGVYFIKIDKNESQTIKRWIRR